MKKVLVAAALAAPIGKFLFSSVTRGRADAYLSWVPLGPVSEVVPEHLRHTGCSSHEPVILLRWLICQVMRGV